ncbi:MAG: type II toxin-antitoxin system RelE/ParE family toxin [Candidatus Binataceae bacterium]
MGRYRLSAPAQRDLSEILAGSAERWGIEGLRRYKSAIVAAIRTVAANPKSPLTRARAELGPGIRSFHIRLARTGDPAAKVKRPVHILYYREAEAGWIEIVGILHERMEPSRHLLS